MNKQDRILDENPENNSFGVVMSKEWIQRGYQKSWLTGNLKEGKNEAAHGRTWKDWIYTAMCEKDLRIGEWNN